MTKNKVLLFLLSFVIAFAMWLYVITIVSPESEATFYNIPVVLQGEAVLEDRGYMLIMEEKPTVTLTLTGNRSDLNKLNSSNITVTADLSRIYEAGIHELQFGNPTYPGDIPSGAVTVKSREPGNLMLKVERRIENRPVDVVINTKVAGKDTAPTPGFEVMETTLDREQIMLTGPASAVDQIAMARIDVNYSGRNTSFGEDYFITLCDENGEPVDSKWVEVDYNSVYLTSIIHQVRQISLGVEVIPGGGATEETSQITLSQKTVKVSGTQDDMKKLDEILTDGKLILGKVDLAEYVADAQVSYKIELPEGIQLHADSDVVTAEITFPDLDVMEMLLMQFEYINEPKGLKGTAKITEMSVRIRGLKSGMETLLREHLTAVVDLSGAVAGEGEYPAQIRINNEKLPGAGALGTYKVLVTVEEVKEAE